MQTPTPGDVFVSQQGTALQHGGFPFLHESVHCRGQHYFLSTEEALSPQKQVLWKSAMGLVKAAGWGTAQKPTKGNM